jgi:DNA-binding response OmpR family regulator
MPSSSPPCPRTLGALPALLTITARPQTLLLVEDSRFAAEAVRLICRHAGIRLRRAETLADARRHLRSYHPELALVDLGLPDGSGLELIAELAAMEARRPRIVAISGDGGRREAALAAGADAFCAKPLDMAGHLAAILGATRAQAQSILDPRLLRPGGAPADARGGQAGGADPMALHDDLKRAHALLRARGSVGYAGQFVGGIARSLNDAKLIAAADLARDRGRRRPLLDVLSARVSAGPSI